MKRPVLFVAALFLSNAANAASASRKAMGANFIGEGGAYKPSDKATDGYLMGDRMPKASVGMQIPAPLARSASAPATAPSALTAGDADAARAGGERDYETKILGVKNAPQRPALADALGASMPAAAALSNENKVFVSLELDPREAGSLRDAVAGLGASVGFSADPRFEALAGPGGTVMFSGWMPAAKLAAAFAQPGVKRVRVETRPRPSFVRETRGEFLIELRLNGAAPSTTDADTGGRALASSAGFRLTRLIGIKTAPDGRSVATLRGTLPLSLLPKALELRDVVKIDPVGGVPSPTFAEASSRRLSLAGFAGFAVRRSPWLILVTLLLLLPDLRSGLRRALSVFNPYR